MITKEFVKQHFLNQYNKIIAQRCSKSYLVKHNLYDDLINYYNDSTSINETIYRIVNNIDIRPVCKICGKPVKFTNGRFPTYCCPKCRNNDPDVIAKNKAGVSKSLKEVYQKRGGEIKNKRKETLKEKYGIETASPFGITQFQDKAKETIKQKYGVDNVLRLSQFRNTREYWQYRSIKLQKEYGYDIEYIIDENGETKILVKNGCNIHGDVVVSLSTFNNRTKLDRKNYTVLCPICNPLKKQETSIETIIKNILDDLNILYIQHDRNQINPYELDFYLPEYNIGIECNGIFWHSGEENGQRILQKYNLCKEKNIKLLNFWEDEIHTKKDIIESYLSNLCNKSKTIILENYIIKEIDDEPYKNFIYENSLIENDNATIKLGLFINNDLKQVLSFNKKNNIYYLCQFCTIKNINIDNSILLNYFINNYNPKQIIAYSFNDIYNEDLYNKLGFIFTKKYNDFWYINKKTFNRKHKLTKSDLKQNIWLKCYTTGYKKYILNL